MIVNFKIYQEVEGLKSTAIARICQEVSEQIGVCIAVCPPAVELSTVASAVSIPVLAQHADPVKPGAHTGWISPESVRSAGASGTLVNHSEHRLAVSDMETVIRS
ncbi:MAG: triose-phosphate isomerase, partial [Euryarchaeota archaeon]|nr:triose-phosphate isomerase [Euryarchaeota archaeon]